MTINPQFLPELLPLSKERQALLDAAQYIREHGWCQKHIKTAGSVCMVGALWRVTGVLINCYGTEAAYRSERLLRCYLRSLAWDKDIHDWNDAPWRTKEEAIAALEAAAFYGL